MTQKAPYFSLPTYQAQEGENFVPENDDVIFSFSERAKLHKGEEHKGFSSSQQYSDLWSSYLDQYVCWLPDIETRLLRTITKFKKRSFAWRTLSAAIHIMCVCFIFWGAPIHVFNHYIEPLIAPGYLLSFLGLAYGQHLNFKASRLEKKRKSISFDDFVLEVTARQKIC